MSDIRWRRLEKDEWHLLEEYYALTGTAESVPDPVTSEVIVLVDGGDTILASFTASLQVLFGPLITGPELLESETQTALYASGFEVMREVCADYGVAGSPILAVQADDGLMNALGCIPAAGTLYVGVV